jgi:hormone-sensitive lipase
MSDNTNVINSTISESNAINVCDTVIELTKLCQNNENFFKNDKTVAGSRILIAFERLKEFLGLSMPVVKEIESFAHTYDYDAKTPGNGYRSFIFIYESALEYSMRVCKYITENRGSLLFRKSLYLKYVFFIFIFHITLLYCCREIDVCAQMIESLHTICVDLLKMHAISENGNLYSKEYSHDNLITKSVKTLNMTCFYGRAVGFQYEESLRPILRYIMVSLACFSESYFSNSYTITKMTNYFLKQPTYFMDPELCARRILNVSMNANVNFCRVKSSWHTVF